MSFTAMKACIFTSVLLCGLGFSLGGERDRSFSWSELEVSRCSQPLDGEPSLHSDDFQWNMSLEQLQAKFHELYHSSKRPPSRAYLDPSTHRLRVPLRNGETFELGKEFIDSVRKQIETALSYGYASFVFFADMGHSHFYVPRDFAATHLQGFTVHDREFYELSTRNSEVKFLYHTAEQLRLTDDQENPLPDHFLNWRLFTRSFIGANDGSGHLQVLFSHVSTRNTFTGDLGEDRYYGGAGFQLHASRGGCIPFNDRGEGRYFDISFQGLTRSTPVIHDLEGRR